MTARGAGGHSFAPTDGGEQAAKRCLRQKKRAAFEAAARLAAPKGDGKRNAATVGRYGAPPSRAPREIRRVPRRERLHPHFLFETSKRKRPCTVKRKDVRRVSMQWLKKCLTRGGSAVGSKR